MITIQSYNRPDSSIFSKIKQPYEVWVNNDQVDQYKNLPSNATVIGTKIPVEVEMLKTGLAYTRNKCIEKHKGKIVWLLDDDISHFINNAKEIVPLEDGLMQAEEYFVNQNKNFGMMGFIDKAFVVFGNNSHGNAVTSKQVVLCNTKVWPDKVNYEYNIKLYEDGDIVFQLLQNNIDSISYKGLAHIKEKVKSVLTPDGKEAAKNYRLMLFKNQYQKWGNILKFKESKQWWIDLNITHRSIKPKFTGFFKPIINNDVLQAFEDKDIPKIIALTN